MLRHKGRPAGIFRAVLQRDRQAADRRPTAGAGKSNHFLFNKSQSLRGKCHFVCLWVCPGCILVESICIYLLCVCIYIKHVLFITIYPCMLCIYQYSHCCSLRRFPSPNFGCRNWLKQRFDAGLSLLVVDVILPISAVPTSRSLKSQVNAVRQWCGYTHPPACKSLICMICIYLHI